MLQFDSTYLLYHWISSSYDNGFKNNKCISKVWGCFVHVWHACNSIFQWHCGIRVCIPEYWIKLRWNISCEKIRDFPTSHHGCLCQWLDSSWDPQSPKVTYQGARYQKPEQPCYQKVPRLFTKNAVTHNLLLTQPWIQKIHGQVLRTVGIGILSTLCEVNLYTQCPRRKPLFTKWHKGHIKGSLMNIGNTLLAIWNQNELCRISGMGLARTTTVTA